MIKSAIAAAILGSTLPAFAATTLVTDGSFESVVQGAGDYSDYSGTDLAGWTALTGSIEVRNAIVGAAEDGSEFVELDSTGNSSMSTTVDTVAGQSYTLSFWYSNRPASLADNNAAGVVDGVAPADTNGLTVDFGTGATAVPTLVADTSADNLWTLYTTTFTATGTTTLTFAATGTSDSIGSSLDNISVVSSVPEPASIAMMAPACSRWWAWDGDDAADPG